MSGQTDSTKFGIGINFIPLYSGTPELQIDYFPLRNWGVSANFGYTDKPLRGGFIMVGDAAETYDLKGYFIKTGLKFRTPSRPGRSFLWFGQIFYVFSAYNETGTNNASLDPAPVINYKGFVNGVAVVFGLEFRLFRFVHFRTGLQFGAYAKRNHLGFPGHTFQPGIGASGQLLNNQLHGGLVFKFGRVDK